MFPPRQPRVEVQRPHDQELRIIHDRIGRRVLELVSAGWTSHSRDLLLQMECMKLGRLSAPQDLASSSSRGQVAEDSPNELGSFVYLGSMQ